MSGPALGSGAIQIRWGTPLPEHQNFASLIGEEQRGIISLMGRKGAAWHASLGYEIFQNVRHGLRHTRGCSRVMPSCHPGQAQAKALLRDGVIDRLCL